MSTQAAPAVPAGVQTTQSRVEIIARVKRGQRRRWLIVGLLTGLLLVAAIALWASLRPKPTPLAARFRAAGVSRGDVVREVQATGRLEAVTTCKSARKSPEELPPSRSTTTIT